MRRERYPPTPIPMAGTTPTEALAEAPTAKRTVRSVGSAGGTALPGWTVGVGAGEMAVLGGFALGGCAVPGRLGGLTGEGGGALEEGPVDAGGSPTGPAEGDAAPEGADGTARDVVTGGGDVAGEGLPDGAGVLVEVAGAGVDEADTAAEWRATASGSYVRATIRAVAWATAAHEGPWKSRSPKVPAMSVTRWSRYCPSWVRETRAGDAAASPSLGQGDRRGRRSVSPRTSACEGQESAQASRAQSRAATRSVPAHTLRARKSLRLSQGRGKSPPSGCPHVTDGVRRPEAKR